MTTPKDPGRDGTGRFAKGNRGRSKGSLNKTTRQLKEMVLQALDECGGVDFLVRQAKKTNNAPFMALLAKVLPLQLEGDPDNPVGIVVNIRQF